MHHEVGGETLEDALRELSYPAIRTDAATALSEERVVVEDRQVNLGAVVDQTDADVFQQPEELLAAVRDVLGDEPTA